MPITIIVPGVESFDNERQIFIRSEDTELELEHSLASLSKWESRFEIPFLSGDEKTPEQIFGYVNAMSLRGDISEEVLSRITNDNMRAINGYIESKMTATWFRETNQPRGFNSEVVTAEIMYHWINALQLDWQVQYWHLNQLITLVKTINEKNKAASDNKKKPLTTQALAERRALMEKRRAAAGEAV